MPPRTPKNQIWEVLGRLLGPQNHKKTAKMWFQDGLGSNLSKNTLFWSILGRAHPRESSSRVGGSTFFKNSLSPDKASKRYQFDPLFWCFSVPKSTKSRFFEHPKNHWNFRVPFFEKKKSENYPKMGHVFSCPNSLFSTLFLTWGPDGVPGALQSPPEVVFRWFGHRVW